MIVSMALFMAKLFPFYFTEFSHETKGHKRKNPGSLVISSIK